MLISIQIFLWVWELSVTLLGSAQVHMCSGTQAGGRLTWGMLFSWHWQEDSLLSELPGKLFSWQREEMQESLTNYTSTSTHISFSKVYPMNNPKSMRGTYTLFSRMHMELLVTTIQSTTLLCFKHKRIYYVELGVHKTVRGAGETGFRRWLR